MLKIDITYDINTICKSSSANATGVGKIGNVKQLGKVVGNNSKIIANNTKIGTGKTFSSLWKRT